MLYKHLIAVIFTSYFTLLGLSPIWGLHVHSPDSFSQRIIHTNDNHHHVHDTKQNHPQHSDHQKESHNSEITESILENLIENKVIVYLGSNSLSQSIFPKKIIKFTQIIPLDLSQRFIFYAPFHKKKPKRQFLKSLLTSRSPPN